MSRINRRELNAMQKRVDAARARGSLVRPRWSSLSEYQRGEFEGQSWAEIGRSFPLDPEVMVERHREAVAYRRARREVGSIRAQGERSAKAKADRKASEARIAAMVAQIKAG